MLCVVSVVDSISQTSMPVNEFVIYRAIHNYDIKQILIVLDNESFAEVNIPEIVDVYFVGNDKKKIRNTVKSIQDQYGDDVVFHLHHQRSAIIFFESTIGLGIRKECFYTVHSTFSGRDIKYKLSSMFCALYANYANCVSNAAYSEFSSIVKKIKKERLLSIPNGVDTDRIDSVISNSFHSDTTKSMVCVGRMIPLKNHVFLIQLLSKLPGYQLKLIGAEDKEGRIRALAKELGVYDRVEFKGLISRNDVFRELQQSSIYVSSSTVEGLPVSVLEAMYVGLVPILSNILPHKEIADECSAVEILPLSIDRWAEKIQALTDFDKKSQFIKEIVKRKFSLETMHMSYFAVYESIIEGNSRKC